MKLSKYNRPYREFEWWNNLCPGGHWKQVSPSVFEGILPQGLLVKTNSALVMSSDSGDATAFVTNLLRVDTGASAIDQEPLILTFDHSLSEVNGYFVHHGDWEGRSEYPGDTFFAAIEASGIEFHYPYDVIPAGSSGLMADLESHSGADEFWKDMKEIRLKNK